MFMKIAGKSTFHGGLQNAGKLAYVLPKDNLRLPMKILRPLVHLLIQEDRFDMYTLHNVEKREFHSHQTFRETKKKSFHKKK